MLRHRFFALHSFDANRAFSTSTQVCGRHAPSRRAVSRGVVMRHDRLDQSDAINAAHAARCDVYISAAVTLFPRE